MTAAEWWTVAGLIVSMAGVMVAFRWGFPQPDRRSMLLIRSKTPEEERADELHRRLSYLGLALLGVGFALQLVGVIV